MPEWSGLSATRGQKGERHETESETCDGSGTKFVCAKEECCPLTGQKIQGRDEVLVENNDRIVMNMYRTVQGKEVKAMEIVSIRKR
jgi:hypothetical protein